MKVQQWIRVGSPAGIKLVGLTVDTSVAGEAVISATISKGGPYVDLTIIADNRPICAHAGDLPITVGEWTGFSVAIPDSNKDQEGSFSFLQQSEVYGDDLPCVGFPSSEADPPRCGP